MQVWRDGEIADRKGGREVEGKGAELWRFGGGAWGDVRPPGSVGGWGSTARRPAAGRVAPAGNERERTRMREER